MHYEWFPYLGLILGGAAGFITGLIERRKAARARA
ncbi:hypothetical protein KIKIMORA_00900 [Brevundimonas phage vB_BpoS-Kikimora]|uniref:Uncharacterized protein n=1 Tax=Brevundimonas phage vB_BpoS-Kikimora TaxID=2948601 RepID=A0A9E7SKY3_9CAUD|nr:hypothetical protein KIKIMORA_00900 [Brevundimonas phage vB_BpoS-Kikimora]